MLACKSSWTFVLCLPYNFILKICYAKFSAGYRPSVTPVMFPIVVKKKKKKDLSVTVWSVVFTPMKWHCLLCSVFFGIAFADHFFEIGS